MTPPELSPALQSSFNSRPVDFVHRTPAPGAERTKGSAMRLRLTASNGLLATGALLAAALTSVATAPVGAADPPSCTPYQLPGLPGGDGNGQVVTISDAGLYGGSAGDADDNGRAVYWTHSGAGLASGWTIHLVPSGLVNDFIGDINVHGVMVGTGDDPSSGATRAYVYDSTTGTLTWLPGLGGGFDEGRRLNDGGVVAGLSANVKGGAYAVTWSPPYAGPDKLPTVGAAQSVGTQDGAHTKMFSEALGINNAGRTVGETSVGAAVPNTDEFARNGEWRGGIAPLFRPMTWAPNGAPTSLPAGFAQGFAWAVNDAGLIVGDSDTADGAERPAYWINGQFHDMGAPADTVYGKTFGLRGSWAAGSVLLGDGTSRGFVWTGTGALQPLEPAAGFDGSSAHGPDEALRQVGGDMGNDSADVAAVWQCPAGFTTG